MKSQTPSVSRTEYWQQQVNAWSKTDVSGVKFCQAHNLVYHQFVYWRQKLLKTDVDVLDSSLQPPTGFSHVSYQPGEPSGLTLSLPNGVEIQGIHAGNVSVAHALLASM